VKNKDRYVVGCDGDNYVYGTEDANGNALHIETFTFKEMKQRAKYITKDTPVFKLVPVTFS